MIRAGLAALAVAGVAALVTFRARLRDDRSAAAEAAPCESGSATACARSGAAPGDGAAAIEGQPRLIEFMSGHCPACDRMAPVVSELERRCLRGEPGSLMRVNVDESAGDALAERYKVRALPTFVGVDARGDEVLRRVGTQSSQELASVLGEVRGRACPPVL